MSEAATVVEHTPTTEETAAAVEVAEIQAEAAVAINQQNTEAAVAIAEIAAEEDGDLEWLKGELAALQSGIATLRADYENLLTQNALQQAEIIALRQDITAMAALTGAAAGAAAAAAEEQTTQQSETPPASSEAEMTQEAEAVAAETAAAAGDAAAHAAAQENHARKRRYLR